MNLKFLNIFRDIRKCDNFFKNWNAEWKHYNICVNTTNKYDNCCYSTTGLPFVNLNEKIKPLKSKQSKFGFASGYDKY